MLSVKQGETLPDCLDQGDYPAMVKRNRKKSEES
jgi:hypothetical protein